MNKQQRLMKQIIRQGAIGAGALVLCGGLYAFSSSLLETSETEKTAADRLLSQEQTKVNALTSQLDKSNTAERRFIETQNDRVNLDFTSNNSALKEWVRNAIYQYRFSSNFKLSLTPDKKVENKELSGGKYDAIEHPGMKFEFSAITDTHIFSFLDDLRVSAPGLIVIETFSMKRLSDIDKSTIGQIRTGNAPMLVETAITFNWIGLTEKKTTDTAAPGAAPTSPNRPGTPAPGQRGR